MRKNICNKMLAVIASCALLVSSALFTVAPLTAQGQTAPHITGVVVTPEKAIQLYWTSTNGETYQIQYASALGGNDDGSTAWQVLYDNYPAHGTNTFIGDFGNYNVVPKIPHPKYGTARFYRILDKGPDSLTNAATVTIDAPAGNTVATGELTVTVTAASDQPGLDYTTLYVDGQKMRFTNIRTNYTIGTTHYIMNTYHLNTCEWLNGEHVLFATTLVAPQYTAQPGAGYAVSPRVSVLFSNLVQGISFSQPLFDPAQGQTQQVSAVFAANSDWTLNIVGAHSNVVQTASGSGMSLLYNWDGTSNGADLPGGLYFYYIYATPNGKAAEAVPGGGSGGNGGITLPAPGMAKASSLNSEASTLWAMPAEGGGAVPLALYPPGLDTSDLTIFSATPAQVSPAKSSVASASLSALNSSGSLSPKASGNDSSATPQATPAAPQRPPNGPARGLIGTFGIAADTYMANGKAGIKDGLVGNGMPYPATATIPLGNNSAVTNISWEPLYGCQKEVDEFSFWMQYFSWSQSFQKVDDQLNINDLRGSGTPFNNVNLGVLMLHGTYGTNYGSTSPTDYSSGANGCKQMYFPVTSGGSGQYLRFSEMNLGGSGTNGLKWMVMEACYSLNQVNWKDMQNKGVHPYNSNLHMILGAQTSVWSKPEKWNRFAQYLSVGTNDTFSDATYNPLTIREAYYQASRDAFKDEKLDGNPTTILAVVSDPACLNDSVLTNSPPSGGAWQYDFQTVYQPPQ